MLGDGWPMVVQRCPDNDIETVLGAQVGNANFAFSLQQLVNLPLMWSLEAHLNVTNATTPFPQAVPVRLLPTPVR